LFLSYFKSGIFYLEGGVESGFKHVEPETYTTRLLLIKGKRYPRVFSMPVEANSLNEGDAFVLDNGMTIYFWAGKEANSHEKLKACEIAVAIKNNERKSKAKLFYPQDQGGQVEEEFWALLGGKPARINAAVPDEVGPQVSEDERS
jgi:Gelsolin repeat